MNLINGKINGENIATQPVYKVRHICKVWCVFLMVMWSEFRMEQYEDHDHREDALLCMLLLHQTFSFREKLLWFLKILFRQNTLFKIIQC